MLYAFYMRPPAVGVLTSVSGPLTELSFHTRPGWQSSTFAYFKVGGHPEEFCSSALGRDSMRSLARRPGVTVEVRYNPRGNLFCRNGVIKTYGLIVDGIIIQSPHSSQWAQKVLAYFMIPGFALFAFWLGLRQSARACQR